MRFLTFDKIKAQLRLDDEQAAAEQELLEMYGDSAENALINLLHRSYADIVEEYDEVPVALVPYLSLSLFPCLAMLLGAGRGLPVTLIR